MKANRSSEWDRLHTHTPVMTPDETLRRGLGIWDLQLEESGTVGQRSGSKMLTGLFGGCSLVWPRAEAVCRVQ